MATKLRNQDSHLGKYKHWRTSTGCLIHTLDIADGAAQLDYADLGLGVAVDADGDLGDALDPRLDGVGDVGHDLRQEPVSMVVMSS